MAAAVPTLVLVAPTPSAAAETTGPVLVHVPVTTAPYGRPIPISLTSTCATGAACSARLFYRTTVAVTPVTLPTVVDPTGFQVVGLSGTATTVDSQQAIAWSGEIPGAAATTTGVDYFVEAEQNGARTVFPGTTYTGGQPSATFLHIHVLSPPLVNHVPVPLAVADQPITIDAHVSCSSGNCGATLWYRRTPLTLDANAGWSSVAMSPQGPGTSLGGAAVLLAYRAQIPASSVDTTGVDYYLHVNDGHTQAYSPGTTYQGYYEPTDGTHSRAATYHVHVAEPPRLVHVPVAASPYRQNIAISARTNCPSTGTCTATLYYRTTPPGALSTAAFTTASMTVTRIAGPGVDAVAVDGVIPGAVADTRGVDYFFSVTDGTTTSWWPGTSAIDGPGVWVDGARALYHHVRVLEPPHLHHVPPTVAQPFTDLVIDAELTCATESCNATLFYTSTPNVAGSYQSVPMARVSASPPNPASRVERRRATIPAAAVTTRGIAYYMTATDGYTNTAAPGTFYWGAYAAIDGSNPAPELARFVVRVVDPPHPVHVPVGVAFTGESVPVEARSNCAASCTATLHWRVTGGAWQAQGMAASAPLPLAYGNDLVTYLAVISGSSVTPTGLEYRIVVTDGYVSETTPTFPVAVTERPLPRSGASRVEFHVSGDLPTFPCNEGGCGTTFAGSGAATGNARGQVGDNTVHALFTMPSGSISGSATYTEPAGAFCPTTGFAGGTGSLSGAATGAVRRSTGPSVPGTVTGISGQFRYSYERLGALARIGITEGTFTVSFEFPDTGPGSFTANIVGAGLGVFVVDAQDTLDRCTTSGALPFEVKGEIALVLS